MADTSQAQAPDQTPPPARVRAKFKVVYTGSPENEAFWTIRMDIQNPPALEGASACWIARSSVCVSCIVRARPTLRSCMLSAGYPGIHRFIRGNPPRLECLIRMQRCARCGTCDPIWMTDWSG